MRCAVCHQHKPDKEYGDESGVHIHALCRACRDLTEALAEPRQQASANEARHLRRPERIYGRHRPARLVPRGDSRLAASIAFVIEQLRDRNAR